MDEILRLFHQYKDAVYRLALSLTGFPADAEDVTQTVFLKLMEKQPELEPGKERAWLLQVTANECRSLYRWLRRRSTVSLDEALAVAAPEYTPLLTHVMQQRPKDRAVLYLFYYEGFSTEEIGRMLHTSQSAVTTRLHRARKTLKATLEQEGYYETGL
ncbi:RNA polymerase sigma factor [Pseudoflavonifractor phocaeensis]|uniref:RNA polymerase sigma factor n=1 Tax=Pseudoflavonifractor phocaeensis TaxID=1870988 RepID=UPI0025A459F2|nr:RNA polymerase sigma factor [Pseudoflavonifractor phocaeensis]MDM8239139.1 RNA polymerase sigma factor [Pseudoflavonifractor phocaeensis]